MTKTAKDVNVIIKKSFEFLDSLCVEKHLTGGIVSMSIYTTADAVSKSTLRNAICVQTNDKHYESVPTLAFTQFVAAVDDCIGSDIVDIRAHIYMSYEELYDLMLECGIDLEAVMESMKLLIRHEVGHIIVERNAWIGKPLSEWCKTFEENSATYKHHRLGTLRKNASNKVALEYFLKYNFLLENERKANEAAGITMKDFVDDFVRRHTELTIRGYHIPDKILNLTRDPNFYDDMVAKLDKLRHEQNES